MEWEYTFIARMLMVIVLYIHLEQIGRLKTVIHNDVMYLPGTQLKILFHQNIMFCAKTLNLAKLRAFNNT